ncbi:MAG: hypothetical protein A2W36_01815 [Chloroflexi bacterium RBG_16_58_14]|nr:MAG: hypothetical protein A2W36_01815 [Chloroflexi bacterium RBG_16_58_14]
MTNRAYYEDLIEACGQDGCPICRMEQTTVEKALKGLLFELTNDIQLREHLRTSFGFCREHARILFEHGKGDALGVSIIYNDVITNILRSLPDPAQAGSAGGGLPGLLQRSRHGLGEQVAAAVKALTPQQRCMLCQQEEETRQAAIKALAESLGDEPFRRALEASEGLCLLHLRLALEAVPDAVSCAALLAISRKQLETLNAELAEFIRKNDYRFHDEGFGHEGDAWKRALNKISGTKK